ncbi:MAG: IS1380 family transposase [Gemmatimonadetes bacterium]|nr:IS1380 family transposase [Gemmatimonadota bacterium]
MQQPKPAPRASHVNFGTSVRHEDLPWPEHDGPVMRMPKLHVETEERATVTRFGGLALAEQFCRRFGVAALIDEHVEVLKIHNPYHESDHVLAQAMSLYVGGTCLEDMMYLQGDEAVLRMLGACRLPDPTTAGDFLRRFDSVEHPAALPGLCHVNNELQQRVWRKLSRRERRRRKRELCVLDVDGHIKELCGVQKEGADFSYKGQWSYQPIIVSMASTGECLAVRNRPGNVGSADGADAVVDDVLEWTTQHFDNVLVRGDSAYDRQDLREVIEHHDGYFAFVGRGHEGRPQQTAALPEEAFVPFVTRAERRREQRRRERGYKPRSKKHNRRRRRSRQRGYKERLQTKQWVAETTYQPPGQPNVYRLVVRRKLIEHRKGQTHLFDAYEYAWVVTNLPDNFGAEDVIDHTYQRCDQENVIEQMGSGLAGWRMPVAEFDGNCAWLEIARLAWNMGKWIAQLVLPAEVVRWEWKRFRLHYILVPAQLIKRARQLWVRIMGARSTIDPLLLAFDAL